MRRRDLEGAARQLVKILGEEDCLLIGGLAVAAHGYVRATQDVDFLVRDLSDAARRLEKGGIAATRTRGTFSCLKGTIRDVRFDVLPPLIPLDWGRAVRVPLGRRTYIRVVDIDGLIRLKLRAGGAKDLMDAAALVLRHAEQRESALEHATAYKLRERLLGWIKDPRMVAELREEEAAEKAPATEGRSKKKRRL
jgi:hypothetical protein